MENTKKCDMKCNGKYVYSDEFNDSDAGSISLDEDDDGSELFGSEDEDGNEDSENSNFDVSDPEDEPKPKRMKAVSSKDFQKKLKHTSSK